jgi:hypothetical protein
LITDNKTDGQESGLVVHNHGVLIARNRNCNIAVVAGPKVEHPDTKLAERKNTKITLLGHTQTENQEEDIHASITIGYNQSTCTSNR